ASNYKGMVASSPRLSPSCGATLGAAFGNGKQRQRRCGEVRRAGGNGGAATTLRLAGWEGLEARKRIAQGKRTPRAPPWVNRQQNFPSPERAAEFFKMNS